MIIGIIAGVIIATGVAGIVFVNRPQFGRLPQGERLERIRKSPHYRDGQFHNLHPTVQMTAKKGRLGALWSFVFKKEEGLRPQGRQDGLEKHRTGRECAGVVRPFFLFYPGGRQADIGRPRFLCGRPAFFP